jgi:hypothetical protein
MNTKIYLITIILSLFNLKVSSQEIGSNIIFSSSGDQRLQNGCGFELNFSQGLEKIIQLEAGISEIKYSNTFQEVPYDQPFGINNVNSTTNKYSGRLNIQIFLKNNEYYALSIGPEGSYNHIKGTQKVNGFLFSDMTNYFYIEDYKPRNNWSWGINTQIKLKNFPIKRTSLLFNIKASFFKESPRVRGIDDPLGGSLNFIEFGIGLNYNLKNK